MVKQINLHTIRLVILSIILLSLTAVPLTANATDIIWIEGDGNWATAAKWQGGVVPGSADKAVLNTSGEVGFTSGTYSVIQLSIIPSTTNLMSLSHAAGALSLTGTDSLIINGLTYEKCTNGDCQTRSSALYLLDGTGSLNTTGNSIIGTNKSGEFFHYSGTKTVGQDLILGRDSGGYGYYELDGGTLNVTGNSIIGQTGWGHFYQEAGTHAVGKDLILANYANLANEESVGYYELWGGNLNVTGNSIIGAAGYSGWFDHYDGTHTVNTNLILGRDAGSWGRYDLMGGLLDVIGNIIVGQSSEGIIVHSAGSNTMGKNLYLGYNSAGTGTYDLSGTGNLSVKLEYIGYSGTGTFNQTATTNAPIYLYLGYNPTGHGTYNLGNDATLKTSAEIIGYSGTGIFNQTAGINQIATNYLLLGRYSSASGTYNLSGEADLSAPTEFIGYAGAGYFNQTGGINNVMNNIYVGYFSGSQGTFTHTAGANTINNGGLYLGYSTASTGTYDLSGTGNLSVKLEYIGYSGTGTFNQTATTNAPIYLYLGYNPTGHGTYNLGNDATLKTSAEIIGYSGTGIFNQTAGINQIATNYLLLGRYSSASGTYNLSGEADLSAPTEFIGYAGAGYFNQTGGINNVMNNIYVGYFSGSQGTFTHTAGINAIINGNLYLGYSSGSTGTYDLSGTGILSVKLEYVGYSGKGTFNQAETTNDTTYLYLGYNPTGHGTYNLDNAGILTSSAEIIGYSGTGIFNQTSGINQIIKNYLILGRYSIASGTYILSGEADLSAPTEFIGYVGTGYFNQIGGTNTVAGTLTISLNPGISNGTYNLSAGTLSATNIINNDQFNYTGGNLNANITNNTGATFNLGGTGTRIVNGNVTNYGTFKATNTIASYTGTFDNYGAYISDPSSNYFNNLFIGASGYLIGGDGDLFSIAGDFLNYSTNSLWDTVGADLAFTSNAVHNFYLGEAGQSFNWDDLTLYGIMHLTGDAYLYADELLGLDLTNFSIIGNGRIYFDAADANNAYLLAYTQGYNYLAASYEGVPEPGTIILLMIGLIGTAFIRKKM